MMAPTYTYCSLFITNVRMSYVKDLHFIGTLELHSYKNKLQEYAQKLSLRLPAYNTVNEGSQHAPQFSSIVLVDGNYYRSTSLFPQRKLAEQDAARVALDDLTKKIKEDGRPLVSEVPILSYIVWLYIWWINACNVQFLV